MRRCVSLLLCIFQASMLGSSMAASSPKGYVLFLNEIGTSWVDLVNVDRTGWVTYRNGFDMHFRDPFEMVLSKSGRLAFLWDFDMTSGVLFSVSPESTFTLNATISGGCGGGGFSSDEKYLFTSSGQYYYGAKSPKLSVYRVSATSCTLRWRATVPTTAVLMGQYQCNSQDQVVASAYNAIIGSESGGLVYRFDRAQERLVLQQYLPTVVYNYSAMSATEERIVYWRGRPLNLMLRRADGVYVPNVSNYPVDRNAGITGAVFTPDSQYCIMAVFSGLTNWGGLHVLRFTADNQMVRTDFKGWIQDAYNLSITPDGKLVAVAWQDGSSGRLVFKLSIYRVNSNGTLTPATTTILPNMVGCMAFLPQAVPPTEAREHWELYE